MLLTKYSYFESELLLSNCDTYVRVLWSEFLSFFLLSSFFFVGTFDSLELVVDLFQIWIYQKSELSIFVFSGEYYSWYFMGFVYY